MKNFINKLLTKIAKAIGFPSGKSDCSPKSQTKVHIPPSLNKK